MSVESDNGFCGWSCEICHGLPVNFWGELRSTTTHSLNVDYALTAGDMFAAPSIRIESKTKVSRALEGEIECSR